MHTPYLGLWDLYLALGNSGILLSVPFCLYLYFFMLSRMNKHQLKIHVMQHLPFPFPPFWINSRTTKLDGHRTEKVAEVWQLYNRWKYCGQLYRVHYVIIATEIQRFETFCVQWEGTRCKTLIHKFTCRLTVSQLKSRCIMISPHIAPVLKFPTQKLTHLSIHQCKWYNYNKIGWIV